MSRTKKDNPCRGSVRCWSVLGSWGAGACLRQLAVMSFWLLMFLQWREKYKQMNCFLAAWKKGATALKTKVFWCCSPQIWSMLSLQMQKDAHGSVSQKHDGWLIIDDNASIRSSESYIKRRKQTMLLTENRESALILRDDRPKYR